MVGEVRLEAERKNQLNQLFIEQVRQSKGDNGRIELSNESNGAVAPFANACEVVSGNVVLINLPG
jgi:hypothetical protein